MAPTTILMVKRIHCQADIIWVNQTSDHHKNKVPDRRQKKKVSALRMDVRSRKEPECYRDAKWMGVLLVPKV